jgi:hypothetical protein
MMVLADSVALQEPHQPGGGGCSSSPTRHSPACDRSWLPTAGVADPVATPPGAGRDHLEAAHRPAVAGCARAVRAVADLLWPAAPLAAGWDLAEDLGGAGRKRARLRPRSPRPGGGASGSGGRGPDDGDATTTTTAPGGPWAASTTPARPAAAAPPRPRSPPGPTLATLEVGAVLRAQPPPTPTRRPLAAWARTAARNA